MNADVKLISVIVNETKKYLLTDYIGFIENFVQIEDKSKHIPIPFKLWDEQKKALTHMHNNRLSIILKARQLGLTWLALSYAVWSAVTTPMYSVTCLSKGEDEAKELIRRIKFILEHMPSFIVVRGFKAVGGIPAWNGSTEAVTIYHPNGEQSYFKSFASAPNSGRSFTSSLVIIDEWAFQDCAAEIYGAAYPTINRPDGGKIIGLSTGLNGTFFSEMWNAALRGENSFAPLFLSVWADPSRDEKWYEQTKKDMPFVYMREYPRQPEEAFTAGEGAAFQEWDKSVHVPFDKTWYPPLGWKIIRSYDGGYMSRACCKWYALSPDGYAVCYREYYPHMVTDVMQAKTIKEMSKAPDGSSEAVSYTVADPSCWQKRSGTGISTAEVFAKEGIHMRPADNDRINGWKRLHEWLRPVEGQDGKRTAKLLFTESCFNTIRTYPSILVDRNRPDDIDTDGEDHAQDCDRYFVMSRPASPLTEEETMRRKNKRSRVVKPMISDVTGY